MEEEIFEGIVGFQWDIGNRHTNGNKHKVSPSECEEIFFNAPLLLYEDKEHSQKEIRMYALGKTDKMRKLFVAFTIRGSLIRVISARDMHRKERLIYEKS